MKALKIRCSAIGKIMATPRSKTEFLSQTAKSYIHELVIQEKYGIRKEFSSRYTDKGKVAVHTRHARPVEHHHCEQAWKCQRKVRTCSLASWDAAAKRVLGGGGRGGLRVSHL